MATVHVQFTFGPACYRASRAKNGDILVQAHHCGKWVETWSLGPHRVGTALLQEREGAQPLTPDEERQ